MKKNNDYKQYIIPGVEAQEMNELNRKINIQHDEMVDQLINMQGVEVSHYKELKKNISKPFNDVKKFVSELEGADKSEMNELDKTMSSMMESISELMDIMIKTHSIAARKNSIANICQVTGAIKAIIMTNKLSNGIGTITLNRALYNEHEKVNAKGRSIVKEVDETTNLVEKSIREKTVMSELFTPIEWEKYHETTEEKSDDDITENKYFNNGFRKDIDG